MVHKTSVIVFRGWTCSCSDFYYTRILIDIDEATATQGYSQTVKIIFRSFPSTILFKFSATFWAQAHQITLEYQAGFICSEESNECPDSLQ